MRILVGLKSSSEMEKEAKNLQGEIIKALPHTEEARVRREVSIGNNVLEGLRACLILALVAHVIFVMIVIINCLRSSQNQEIS